MMHEPDHPPPPMRQGGGWATGTVIIITNGFLAWIAHGILEETGIRGIPAIMITVIGYTLTTMLFLMIDSQALTHIILNGQKQKTKRQYIRSAERVKMAHYMTELPTITEQTDAINVGGMLSGPVEGLHRDSIRWARNLYGEDGKPSDKRLHLSVRNRRFQGMVRRHIPLGEDERSWLVETGILLLVEGNYVLNIRRFPTLRHLEKFVDP